METTDTAKRKSRPLVAFAAFLALALFMYVSIMYKIVNYGP